MKKMIENARAEGFIVGAIIGAAIAALATLLLAPKSGKDLRKDIGEGTTKTLEHTDEYLEDARKKGTKVMHDVEDTASSYFDVAGDKVGGALSKTKGMFRRKADKVEDTVEDVADDAKDKYKEAKDEYKTYQFKK